MCIYLYCTHVYHWGIVLLVVTNNMQYSVISSQNVRTRCHTCFGNITNYGSRVTTPRKTNDTNSVMNSHLEHVQKPSSLHFVTHSIRECPIALAKKAFNGPTDNSMDKSLRRRRHHVCHYRCVSQDRPPFNFIKMNAMMAHQVWIVDPTTLRILDPTTLKILPQRVRIVLSHIGTGISRSDMDSGHIVHSQVTAIHSRESFARSPLSSPATLCSTS